MAAAIAALIDDASKRGALVARGRARARVYDWGRVAAKYAEIYAELVRRRPA
jgi:glycosyltransferase involved in cell wall biosynthesis